MIKTDWNLKGLYKNPKDTKLEKDIQKVEVVTKKFRRAFLSKRGDFSKPQVLKKVLEAYEKIIFSPEVIQPMYYLWLYSCIDSANNLVEQKLGQFDERLTKSFENIRFFLLTVGAISQTKQKQLLKNKSLEEYHYVLQKIFDQNKHRLSEAEERIVSLKKQTSSTLWVQGVQKFLSKQVVSFKGNDIPLAEALSLIRTLPKKQRRDLFYRTYAVLGAGADFAESELNAVVLNRKTSDELRGYEKPYSATALAYQNTEKEIEAVTTAVTEDFVTSKKFFALKKKMLGLEDMEYADKDVSIGKIKKEFSFSETKDIIKEAFRKFDPRFEDIFDSFLARGQISVFPQKGKRGGAFCASDVGVPTFVLLNHTNDLYSLRTCAHEMGHAIHSELSKTQNSRYQSYSIASAEVASTFFEKVVMDLVENQLTKKEKIILLHDTLNDQVSTIHRQVAAFNFERELHETVRVEGFQSKKDIGKMLRKHMKTYLGTAIQVPEAVDNLFVQWRHFRRYFYVYTYAYGCLISNTLYAMYKEDESVKEGIIDFLSAGGSMPPREIFKKLGIDTEKKETYVKGLQAIEDNITSLQKLLS